MPSDTGASLLAAVAPLGPLYVAQSSIFHTTHGHPFMQTQVQSNGQLNCCNCATSATCLALSTRLQATNDHIKRLSD